MEQELLNIARKQLKNLPEKIQGVVLSQETSDVLNDIAKQQNLSAKQAQKLNTEVFLLLLCLTSPKDFAQILKDRLTLNEVTLSTLLKSLEEKVLEPIYPDLLRFYDGQQTELVRIEQNPENPTQAPEVLQAQREEQVSIPAEITPEPRAWQKVAEVVPENLPTGDDVPESFLPNLTPKESSPSEENHPFEEKMKKVFTAGSVSMTDLSLEPNIPKKPEVAIARPATHDPYREPIEI